MEWPYVVVFGADRGAMPHDLAGDIEEERRVFHVAMTRAMDQVVILADEERPSRFLSELDGSAPHTAAAEDAPSSSRTRRRREREPHVYVGDRVRVRGGYSGAVVAVNGSQLSVRLETGADLIVPSSDVLHVEIPAGSDASGEADPGLLESLRRWRRETSGRLAVPAYVVMHDATMEAIAVARPLNERQLIGVPGIGPAKLESYGDEILALVAAAQTE